MAKRRKNSTKVKQKKRDGQPALRRAVPHIAMKQVDDPWEPGKTIVVPTNVHESPVEILRSKGRIDLIQYAAAEKFRRIYERSQISPLKGMNIMKEPVDGGGGSPDLINQNSIQAQKELAKLERRISQDRMRMLRAVVGEGTSITEISKRHPFLKTLYAMGHTTGELIGAINDLVSYWDMRVIGNNGSTVADRHSTVTGPQKEWEIGRHGDLVEKQRP